MGDQPKYIIPDNWRYKMARKLFVSPDVTDKKDLPKSVWEMPKEKELTEFLVNKMSFNMDRVNKGIQRLKKCRGKASQKRLDSFFKIMPSTKKNKKRIIRNCQERKGKEMMIMVLHK